MRIGISLLIITFLNIGWAKASCINELKDIKSKVENGLSAYTGPVASYCKLWLNNRKEYDKEKASRGADPCPGEDNVWKGMKDILMDGYYSAKKICSSSSCNKGCGDFLSILRSGGSFSKALKNVPE